MTFNTLKLGLASVFGIIAPVGILLFGLTFRVPPVALLALLLLSVILATLSYCWRRGLEPHTVEFAFTILLCFVTFLVALMPISIPVNSVKPDDKLEPCLWLFKHGTPCLFGSPNGHVLNRFSIWEFAAVTQTVVFAALIYLELAIVGGGAAYKPGPVTVVLFIAIAALVTMWLMTDKHHWNWQLFATIVFTGLIFLVDMLLWRQIREDIKKASGDSLKQEMLRIDLVCLGRIAWVIDVGIVAAVVLVATVAAGVFGRTLDGDDERLSEVFFAGGTAFSLLLGNLSLIILRVIKHSETFSALKRHAHPVSLFNFVGLSMKARHAE